MDVASGSGTLASKDTGAQPITGFGNLTLGNNAAGDYTLTGVTGSVTIASLHIRGGFTASTKTYDGTVAATVLSVSLYGVLTGDPVALYGGTATFDTSNVGQGTTVTLAGASLIGADARDYVLDSVANTTASITKAHASISITPYNVTYDGAAHTATGTATGVLGNILAGLDLTATTHTNAGSYSGVGWTFTDATGNYYNASGNINDSIAKADATISITPYSVTYNGAAHTAIGAATGVLGNILAGLSLSRDDPHQCRVLHRRRLDVHRRHRQLLQCLRQRQRLHRQGDRHDLGHALQRHLRRGATRPPRGNRRARRDPRRPRTEPGPPTPTPAPTPATPGRSTIPPATTTTPPATSTTPSPRRCHDLGHALQRHL